MEFLFLSDCERVGMWRRLVIVFTFFFVSVKSLSGNRREKLLYLLVAFYLVECCCLHSNCMAGLTCVVHYPHLSSGSSRSV